MQLSSTFPIQGIQGSLLPHVPSRSLCFERVYQILQKLKPLAAPNWDREGRLIQLWKTHDSKLIGGVLDQKGQLTIIPARRISHPLVRHEEEGEVIRKLESVAAKRWDLVYDPLKGEIVVWPHLEAAGGKWRDGEIWTYNSPVQNLSREQIVNELLRRGYKNETDGKVPEFGKGAYTKGKIVIHIDPRKGNEPAHIDVTYTKEALKTTYRENLREKLKNENDPTKKDELEKKLDNLNAGQKLPRYRFAYKDDEGGGGGPLNQKDPSQKQFQETLQQTGLTKSYNSNHETQPMPEKGMTGGEIGGVACSTEYIEGLFDTVDCLFEHIHYFCLPQLGDGQAPFSDAELRQILRELAIGIYVHDTIPFFSLHFNQKTDLHPVIHPAYANTLVGRVIGFLDYFMKGYLNGGIFRESFIDEWHKNPQWKNDSFLSEMIDLDDYCRKNLSGDDQHYGSLRALLKEMNSGFLQKLLSQLGSPKQVVISNYHYNHR